MYGSQKQCLASIFILVTLLRNKQQKEAHSLSSSPHKKAVGIKPMKQRQPSVFLAVRTGHLAFIQTGSAC